MTKQSRNIDAILYIESQSAHELLEIVYLSNLYFVFFFRLNLSILSKPSSVDIVYGIRDWKQLCMCSVLFVF